MKLNDLDKKKLLNYMKELNYNDYYIYNSNIEIVKKFWCALNRLYGIRYLSDIIDLITSYIKDSEVEFSESRLKKCERLSLEFLVFLCSRSNLLKNE